MLEYKAKGQILSAISKPYDFDGKSGTSHRVRVLTGGEIFNCKSSESQVELMKTVVGKEGEIVLGISSPKEAIAVELLGFTPAK